MGTLAPFREVFLCAPCVSYMSRRARLAPTRWLISVDEASSGDLSTCLLTSPRCCALERPMQAKVSSLGCSHALSRCGRGWKETGGIAEVSKYRCIYQAC